MTSKNNPRDITVLVVDDQESVKSLICTMLKSEGYSVVSASSGAEALSLYRNADRPVDLLVTDYQMPGMTGVELARECCAHDGDLAVLYVSGSKPTDNLRADVAAGRRGFLAKPFWKGDLLRSVRAVLDMEPAADYASFERAATGAMAKGM
jgi:CheY-like chemotaxis protein